MATKKISELAPSGALTGAEIVPVVKDGVTVRTTAQDIADLGGGGGSATVYTQEFTAASSIEFDGFTVTPNSLVELYLEAAMSEDDSKITGTLKLNGSYKTSDYRFAGKLVSSTGNDNEFASQSAAGFDLSKSGSGWGIGSNTLEGIIAKITLTNPHTSSLRKMGRVESTWVAPSGATASGYGASFSYEGTDVGAVCEGIKLEPSSGTFTGKARLVVT